MKKLGLLILLLVAFQNMIFAQNSWMNLMKTGAQYYQYGRYQEAEQIFLEAKSQAKTQYGKTHQYYATACNNLAETYRKQIKLEEAELLYLESIKIVAKTLGKKHPEYGMNCNNLALNYEAKGEFSKAEKLFLEAKTIQENALGKNDPNYGMTCQNLAELYTILGKYSKAETLFNETRHIFEKNALSFEYAMSCELLAELYKKQGEYEQAFKLIEIAKNIRLKLFGENHPDYANSCVNMGQVYEWRKDDYQAEKSYQKALEIYEKTLGINHPNYARACGELANFYFQNKMYSEAEYYFSYAKTLFEKSLGKNSIMYAKACDNLAVFYASQKDKTEAEANYLEALEIAEKTVGKDHFDFALVSNNLGKFYTNEKKLEEALPHFTNAIQFIQKDLQENFAGLNEEIKRRYLYEKQFYFNDFYDFGVYFLESNSTKKEAFLETIFDLQLTKKGILFSATQKMRHRILNSKDEKLIELFEQWTDVKHQLSRAHNLSQEELKIQKIDVQKLELSAKEKEKELAQKSPDFAHTFTPKKVTTKDLQKKLKPNEIAIEMIRISFLEDSTEVQKTAYLALILSKEKIYSVLMKNGDKMDAKIKTYRNQIRFEAKDRLSYKLFWLPIENELKAQKLNPEKIYFSPDGLYNSLNLNTLQNPVSKQYLINNYHFSIHTNLKEIIEKPTSNKDKRANIFGRPDYKMSAEDYEKETKNITPKDRSDDIGRGENNSILSSSFSDLQGTEIETKSIASILQKNGWKVDLAIGKQALEERVKQVENPKILHIATHGYFSESDKNEGMLNAGIVLAGVQTQGKKFEDEDGVLTAYEATGLHLDETDLVVLSACETALGENVAGEGIYGLQRGFKVAGAKTVLMSLWKVDDTATQELMTNFYELWLSGKSKQIAFREAQIQLKEKYPHPRYWGAFVMIGK